MNDALGDLAELTDALYQAELQKMSVLNAQEADLRKKLADLEAHRRENQALAPADLHSLCQIGGDVLWQGWVARSRQHLMTRLAQILAQKAREKALLQRAFGKRMAAQDMLDAAKSQKAKAAQKRALQVQDDLQMINTSQR